VEIWFIPKAFQVVSHSHIVSECEHFSLIFPPAAQAFSSFPIRFAAVKVFFQRVEHKRVDFFNDFFLAVSRLYIALDALFAIETDESFGHTPVLCFGRKAYGNLIEIPFSVINVLSQSRKNVWVVNRERYLCKLDSKLK